MKIDSAIKTFFEKYDREAIQSIDTISKEYGLNIHNSVIKAFNLTESFNIFNQYLKGYADYRINTPNNLEDKPLDIIKESVKAFIGTKIFEEADIKYIDLPKFVTGYIDGINSLIETVDQIKRDMMDANVNHQYIGVVNEFTDMFMDKLHESYDPIMEKILWASGYNSKKKLSDTNSNKTKSPVFL